MTDDITTCDLCGAALDITANPLTKGHEMIAYCTEGCIGKVDDPEEVGRIAYQMAYFGVGNCPEAKHLFDLAGKASDIGHWGSVIELSMLALGYEWRFARGSGPRNTSQGMLDRILSQMGSGVKTVQDLKAAFRRLWGIERSLVERHLAVLVLEGRVDRDGDDISVVA